jgi:hypothetical protein
MGVDLSTLRLPWASSCVRSFDRNPTRSPAASNVRVADTVLPALVNVASSDRSPIVSHERQIEHRRWCLHYARGARADSREVNRYRAYEHVARMHKALAVTAPQVRRLQASTVDHTWSFTPTHLLGRVGASQTNQLVRSWTKRVRRSIDVRMRLTSWIDLHCCRAYLGGGCHSPRVLGQAVTTTIRPPAALILWDQFIRRNSERRLSS